jgi:hypothetical protein
MFDVGIWVLEFGSWILRFGISTMIMDLIIYKDNSINDDEEITLPDNVVYPYRD